ncbi:DNA damage-binding protein 1 [Exophiala viscosa]|uniref:DNA damage-binding protein 1 n=1 Tax=Exophiala viscosa TaxID=2486360 RepID=UPI00218EA7F9|nr:DNA damage-binding protein 1 [Exophiala viscosa]
MSYVVPIHRPSGVRHAIKLNFLGPDADTLIVAKANRLEIYEQGTEGLSLLYTKTVYGYITILERFRPSSSKTDHLFIGTDRYQYFTCSWDADIRQLRTEQSYVDLADKVLRDSRELDRCHIDPTGRFMTLELYDGVVTVLAFVQPSNKRVKRESTSNTQVGTLGEPVQVRIEELLTRSSAFVESDDPKENPKIAILWEDNQENPQLKLRELKYYPGGEQATADLETVAELNGDQLDKGVSHLIPVAAPYGGFIILGDHTIRYVDRELQNVIEEPLDDNATIWTCWTKIDDQRWLLADDFGRLFFLMIEVTGFEVSSWRLDPIGEASKASCLVYLDEGYVFVGSHSGDSQVVHIEEGGVRVVQTFPNIAPILDFSIMDLGRGSEGGQSLEFSSGQARIVAASGAWQDGTIRSVRSGVGLEELGTIGELSHVTDLWGLSSTGQSDVHDTLLVSFVTETRIFRFDSEASVEEVEEFHHLDLTQPTLYAANLPDRRLVQVCEGGLRITDLESSMLTLEWRPPDAAAKITAACADSVHLLVVEGGHTLHVFHAANSESKPTISKTFPAESQMSSVTVPDSNSNVCIVSFWQTASVAILDLHSLEVLQSQSLGSPGTDIPRSVLVANVLPDAPPNLFVAMADGTVLSYSFDSTKNTLSGMTRILLGTEPVFFKQLPKDPQSGSTLSNIFASCEQPSLIYSSEGRIIYSAVNAESASRVCNFNSEAYPGAIAIAAPKELKLALIGKERTTQLQTLLIGETVRCLSYEPTAKMFAMGCVRRIMESGTEALLSSVKIADEVSFKEIDSIELEDSELVECVISTGSFETENESQDFGEMFVVGTSILEQDDLGMEDRLKGRIIVYEVNKERKLKQVTQIRVKGACRSLAMCDGKIVAGLVKTVVLYGLVPSSTRGGHSLELSKLATYRTSTNPLSLAITPATSDTPAQIAVADLMKSLSILQVVPPNSTNPEYKLRETSRHFATVWSSATAAIAENEWVVADMEGNLITLRQGTQDGTEADYRRRLEVTGEFRLGEVVNKMVPLSSTPAPSQHKSTGKDTKMTDADGGEIAGKRSLDPKMPRVGPLVTPRAFAATVEGAIYMLATINPAYVNVLLLLQSALASRVQAPGYMPWTKFRAWKTEVMEKDEPFRVVDGEMVEQGLLALDDQQLETVLREGGLMEQALNVSVQEARAWGDELRRLY